MLKLSSGKTVLIGLVLYIVAAAGMSWLESQIKAASGPDFVGILDLVIIPPEDVGATYAMLESYGEAGRNTYFWGEIVFDTVYPLVYTFFFLSLLAWLFVSAEKKMPIWAKLKWAPVATVIIDYFENACILVLLANYPGELDSWVLALHVLRFFKWSSVGLSVLLVLIGAGFKVAKV